MKILLAHLHYAPGIDRWYQRVAEAAPEGIDVRTYSVSIDPPSPRMSWPELDRLWRRRDRKLLEMAEGLIEAAEGCDVLLHYNGANIHPGMLASLKTFNVYCCFDDPEASATVSAPVASSFDAVMHGNIASRWQYEALGCKRLAWLPIFVSPDDIPIRSQRDAIFNDSRDIPISYVGERNHYRNRRLDALTTAFPDARCYGSGWPNGRIATDALSDLYRRTRVGWNVHNSTGPINQRTFLLPAHGIAQICDNKTGLGRIFKLGEEALGFNTINEAIDLTHGLLKDQDRRRSIARLGYERFWKDYHPTAVWQRIADQLQTWGARPNVSAPCPLPKSAGFLCRHIDALRARFASGSRATPMTQRPFTDAFSLDEPHPHDDLHAGTPTGLCDPACVRWAVEGLIRHGADEAELVIVDDESHASTDWDKMFPHRSAASRVIVVINRCRPADAIRLRTTLCRHGSTARFYTLWRSDVPWLVPYHPDTVADARVLTPVIAEVFLPESLERTPPAPLAA